jgi:superfamily II DNA/RNA helicase
VLVIDEADRILEIGFEEDMREIIKLPNPPPTFLSPSFLPLTLSQPPSHLLPVRFL